MKTLHVYTDGTAKETEGGWAFLLFEDGTDMDSDAFEVNNGRVENTTNSRMCVLAVVNAFEYVFENFHAVTEIHLYTDNQYIVNTMTEGWSKKKNADLWNRLDHVVGAFKVHWHLVSKANDYNVIVNEIARSAYS